MGREEEELKIRAKYNICRSVEGRHYGVNPVWHEIVFLLAFKRELREYSAVSHSRRLFFIIIKLRFLPVQMRGAAVTIRMALLNRGVLYLWNKIDIGTKNRKGKLHVRILNNTLP